MTSPVVALVFVASVLSSGLAASGAGSRIMGGQDANIEDYPYMVSLQQNGAHSCGGAILNTVTILTAAHCFRSTEPSDFSIRAGSSIPEEGGQVITVARFYRYPEFNPANSDRNVGIAKLVSPLVFGEGVQPIELPYRYLKVPHGTLASLTGFGSKYFLGPNAEHLQQVYLPVVDNEICRIAYQEMGEIQSFHLCAGSEGRDACNNDSGGPLVLNGAVIGIVSLGFQCGINGFPGIYTRVSEFIDFIEAHM